MKYIQQSTLNSIKFKYLQFSRYFKEITNIRQGHFLLFLFTVSCTISTSHKPLPSRIILSMKIVSTLPIFFPKYLKGLLPSCGKVFVQGISEIWRHFNMARHLPKVSKEKGLFPLYNNCNSNLGYCKNFVHCKQTLLQQTVKSTTGI